MSDQQAALDAAAAAKAAADAARQLTITQWTLYSFGILVTILRTYARFKAVGFNNFEGDDYFVWVAAILYSVQNALGHEVGHSAHGLANNAMTPEQRATLSPSDPEYEMRVIGSKIQVAGWTCYVTLMMALKVAMCYFFLRLTKGLGRNYRIRVYSAFALVIGGWLAAVLSVLIGCRPFHNYWQIYPDPGMNCYPAVSRPIVWTSYVTTVLGDIYLILIPIPLLWRSRLRLIEKIASTLVLGAGIFVVACCTIKTVFVITDDKNGAQLAGEWGTREAFTAVITTNLPMVFPLIKQWLRPLIGSSNKSSKQYKTPEGFQTIGGGGGSGSHTRGRMTKTNRSNNPLTNVTFTESEERIVNDMKLQNIKVAATATAAPAENGKDVNHGFHGIMVKTEYHVSEDRSSHNEQDPKQPGDAW